MPGDMPCLAAGVQGGSRLGIGHHQELPARPAPPAGGHFAQCLLTFLTLSAVPRAANYFR